MISPLAIHPHRRAMLEVVVVAYAPVAHLVRNQQQAVAHTLLYGRLHIATHPRKRLDEPFQHIAHNGEGQQQDSQHDHHCPIDSR